jgi:hypothetical protein
MLYRLPPLCVVCLLLMGSPAYAHRLWMTYEVLPENKVRVTSFYGPDDWAADGIVAVYRPNGQLLAERGVLNDKGVYIFSYRQAEDLKVVVTHDGHSKMVTIAAKELGNAEAPQAAEEFPLWQIVAGLSLVLALAAFYQSVRTAQRVRELQRLSLPPVFLTQPPPAQPVHQTAVTAARSATEIPRPATLPTAPAPG